jgi:hypothetical protein
VGEKGEETEVDLWVLAVGAGVDRGGPATKLCFGRQRRAAPARLRRRVGAGEELGSFLRRWGGDSRGCFGRGEGGTTSLMASYLRRRPWRWRELLKWAKASGNGPLRISGRRESFLDAGLRQRRAEEGTSTE